MKNILYLITHPDDELFNLVLSGIGKIEEATHGLLVCGTGYNNKRMFSFNKIANNLFNIK